MPPSTRAPLKVCDEVDVLAIDAFNILWVKENYPQTWHRERIAGVVSDKVGDKWCVSFPDGEVKHLSRPKINFLKRPPATHHEGEPVIEEDSSSERESGAEEPAADSSDNDGEPSFFNEEADHDNYPEKSGKKSDTLDISDRWQQEELFNFDQRAKFGYYEQYGPHINAGLADNHDKPLHKILFELGVHFLPVIYLMGMASKMEVAGAALHTANVPGYAGWLVSIHDLLQWIGVWIYYLAFPQTGHRHGYWTEPAGGYGPRHQLQRWLALGQNGEKSFAWFSKMERAFALPEAPDAKDAAMKATLGWWTALRDSFHGAVTASWLLCLDESMVAWQGLGMPGLMVILRKPTPIGLELHTLCCALSGILTWFEVYEGKDVMAMKEYNDEYPKSIALTLRMTENYHNTGRVLIADSWFGSVACAIALFRVGLFCVMNVKTATKNYPKNDLMSEVGEIKGKTDLARKQRRDRRGKSLAFTQDVSVGKKGTLTLLAAGHNKKVPLLLIATAMTMLPGKTHNKTWKVNQADGTITQHSLSTRQPEVHALYRLWMNIVDIHNKLRQGVVSMADVWGTVSWEKRHFAEGLGFWEVNVFKTLIYFYPKYKGMPHGEFRARLAWSFMTLGKVAYPADATDPAVSGIYTADTASSSFSNTTPNSSSSNPTPNTTLPTAPLPGGTHHYQSTGHSPKTCSYCKTACYQVCTTCRELGLGTFAVCGRLTKRPCMAQHATGIAPSHGNFQMTSPAKRNMKAAAQARKAARDGGGADERCEDADEDYSDDSDDSDDSDGGTPVGSPLRQSRRARKRAKKARKATRKAAAAQAAHELEQVRRSARAGKRAINREWPPAQSAV